MITYQDDTVTICGPRAWKEYSRESVGIKWCFGCRKHLEYFWIVEGDPSPDDWYGPSARFACSVCNESRTLFPGWTYEWDD